MFIDCSHYQCRFYDGISIFLTSRSGCGSTLLLALGIIPFENMDHISWFLQLCALHGINFDCALFTDQGPLLSVAQKLSKTSRPLKLSLMFCLQHLIRNVCHRFSNIRTDFPLKECHEGMTHSETMESFFKSFGCFIEKVLKSKARLKTLIKKELIEIKEMFGEARKSPIIESSNAKVFSEEDTLVTEPITVVLSKAGWIRSAKGHDIDPHSLSYRGDDNLQDFARGKSNQLAVFLDSNGKAYSIPSHSLPSARGMGEPITGRLNADSGVQFISSIIGEENGKYLIMNTAGYGYISEFKNMTSNKKTGRAFMKLPEHAKMLKAIPIREDHSYIAAVSNIGKLLIFKLEELPILGKGKGNKIINIPKDKLSAGEEFMAHAQVLADESSLMIEVGKRSVTLKPKDWNEYILYLSLIHI